MINGGGGDGAQPRRHSTDYSPNLNPTELVLAKFKTLLCKADKRSIAAMV
jgi:hypothetical protein